MPWGSYEDKVNSISPSGIVQMAHSPKHYYSSKILKETEPTPAMEEGTIVHMFLLEPEKFNEKYAFPLDPKMLEGSLKTTEDIKGELRRLGLKLTGNKEELTERLQLADPGARFYDLEIQRLIGAKELLSEKKAKMLNRIKEEVFAHPFASKLVFGEGENEKLGHFIHPMTKAVVRFQIDRTVKLKNKRVILDVKRTDKITKRQFELHMWDMKLHVLAAMYVDAVKEIENEDSIFCWIAVQPKPPYIVKTYVADFGALEAGRTEAFQAMELWKKCRETNHWPSDDESLINTSLPHFAWAQIEEVDTEEEIAVTGL